MIIFRHQSPNYFAKLEPTSYSKIENARNNSTYVKDRIKQEKIYHTLLKDKPVNSFIYATIVGFHKMQSSKKYPGYTYYFKLTPEQIKHTIFHVVGQGKHTTQPMVGRKGLIAAIKYWLEHEEELKPYYDSVVGGDIDPRIEVVIGYSVKYSTYVPQVEDR